MQFDWPTLRSTCLPFLRLQIIVMGGLSQVTNE
jgi:hypothetical protein